MFKGIDYCHQTGITNIRFGAMECSICWFREEYPVSSGASHLRDLEGCVIADGVSF